MHYIINLFTYYGIQVTFYLNKEKRALRSRRPGISSMGNVLDSSATQKLM